MREKIKPITSSDLLEIQDWYALRGLTMAPKDELPPSGLIIPGVAASYLIKTDSKIVMSEFTISNPQASKEDRSEAIHAIYEEFTHQAKLEGFKTILITTQISHMETLANQLQFKNIPNCSVWFKRI